MRIITGLKKTTLAIDLCVARNAYLVVHSKEEAHRVFRYAIDQNLYSFHHPITYDEFLSKKYFGRGIDAFVIDNIDMLLARLSDVPVLAITFRAEETKK